MQIQWILLITCIKWLQHFFIRLLNFSYRNGCMNSTGMEIFNENQVIAYSYQIDSFSITIYWLFFILSFLNILPFLKMVFLLEGNLSRIQIMHHIIIWISFQDFISGFSFCDLHIHWDLIPFPCVWMDNFIWFLFLVFGWIILTFQGNWNTQNMNFSTLFK